MSRELKGGQHQHSLQLREQHLRTDGILAHCYYTDNPKGMQIRLTAIASPWSSEGDPELQRDPESCRGGRSEACTYVHVYAADHSYLLEDQGFDGAEQRSLQGSLWHSGLGLLRPPQSLDPSRDHTFRFRLARSSRPLRRRGGSYRCEGATAAIFTAAAPYPARHG